MIQCLDLKKQHLLLKEEIFKEFEKVFDTTAFSGGFFVEKFEKEFSEYCGAKYTVAVNSGTSALHLALIALRVKPGDEIIVPANTFIATAWAISYVGAVPVFVDCDPDTWTISPSSLKSIITSRTKGIIGVHLYGQPFDIDPVKEIADKNKLFLLEDAAQAHGARYNGKSIGSSGNLSCFSFYPGKNLGACGEGGAIVTDNETVAKHLMALRNHSSVVRYYHDELGFNYRMGGLEAASLSVKLRYLEKWNNRRKEIAERYFKTIKNLKISLQLQPEYSESVYHLFVAVTEDREALVEHLKRKSINPGFHYPVPCHLQKAYLSLGYTEGCCPNAEYLAKHCISLPMYAELSDEEVAIVVESVNNFT